MKKNNVEKQLCLNDTTGSLDIKEKSLDEKSKDKIQDSKLNIDSEQVDLIMKKIFDSEFIETQLASTCTPYYCIKSNSDSIWLYSFAKKTYLPVKANLQIIPVEEIDDENTCCMIGNDTYSVPNNIIHCLGWN